MKKETDIERVCAYCEHAAPLPGQDTVLCDKKGVVNGGYLCRRFVYDPLKRKPKRPPKLPGLEAEPADPNP